MPCHPVGAGLPAKGTPRCMAPAMPVFAGKPAPTEAVWPLWSGEPPLHKARVGQPLSTGLYGPP
ncbi:hypothetical protein EGT09_11220 [Pseudomonas putida]|nr:hypothetical protein EGT09_11220 [Pseudomonas putida]